MHSRSCGRIPAAHRQRARRQRWPDRRATGLSAQTEVRRDFRIAHRDGHCRYARRPV